MIDKETVKDIVHDYLAGSDIFLVKLSVSKQNNIRVFLDGDQGVTIADCTGLSRHIESLLDRNKEDYDLEVSSVGVGQPLTLIRQYKNNIGRRLKISAEGEMYVSGKLVDVQEKGITIEKDKPEKGKKKRNVPETDSESKVFLPFDKIVEAKVQVSFK